MQAAFFIQEAVRMYIKKKHAVIGAAVLIVVTAFTTVLLVNPFGISGIDDFFKLRAGISIVKNYFYEEIENSDIVDGALEGLEAFIQRQGQRILQMTRIRHTCLLIRLMTICQA